MGCSVGWLGFCVARFRGTFGGCYFLGVAKGEGLYRTREKTHHLMWLMDVTVKICVLIFRFLLGKMNHK